MGAAMKADDDLFFAYLDVRRHIDQIPEDLARLRVAVCAGVAARGGHGAAAGRGSGTMVGIIVWLWRGIALAGVSIGTSLLLALCAACLFGLSIPAALHALKLDPKIAAGPVTLAFTDIFTLLFYFGLAAWLL